MVWIVRTFRNEKNSDFQYNKYFDDHEFNTKDDAVFYRKTLKQMSELFEVTRMN